MKFENLEVWQRSYALAVDVYKIFSQNRDYGFKNQITRSALSVPSNIAEGWERYTEKEKFRFLSIAKGSAGELKTQLMIAVDIGYIAEDIGAIKIKEIDEIALMLGGLMKSLNTQK
ncbi:MAG: four helix bundle protein [Paraglaciecola sp.]|nr:four helix bundle protein [Paraglaciecola sp.]